MLSCNYSSSDWPDKNLPQTDVRSVVDFLRSKPDIDSVTVNSTLGKHKICSYHHLVRDPVLEQDHTLISGANRGKALFICNKQDREADKENRDGKGWEYQYHDTMSILKDYLHLDVSETGGCTTVEHKRTCKKMQFFDLSSQP